jgi:hypothetical protein
VAGAGSVAAVSRRPLLRRPGVWVLLGVLAVVGAVGLALFQPWKLVVDETVNEAAPAGLAEPAVPPAAQPPATGSHAAGSSGGTGPTSTSAPAPRLLASGEFVSHEHRTTGSVRVVGLPDGRRVLRIEDLDTSNGPDLRVWITDAPVKPGRDGWFVFDDGRYVELGRLKGNKGSQNYDLPASVDLSQLDGLSIWCDRFNVSFGAAELRAP